jgi:hypothetical protein
MLFLSSSSCPKPISLSEPLRSSSSLRPSIEDGRRRHLDRRQERDARRVLSMVFGRIRSDLLNVRRCTCVGLTDPAETHAQPDLWPEYKERSGPSSLFLSPLRPSSSPLSPKPPDGSNCAHNNLWFFFCLDCVCLFCICFWFGVNV